MPTSIISGTVVDPSGTPLIGAVVTARIVPEGSTRVSDGASITPVETTITNGSGAWSLTLEEQTNILPATSYYFVEEKYSGFGNFYAIKVPAADSSVEDCKVEYISPPQMQMDEDAEGAIVDHLAHSDPHSQYATDVDLSTHVANADPHPNYATDTNLATHEADTTAIHGIADTVLLETQAGATAKITTHEAAGNPHPAYATDTDLTNHVAAADPHTGYALDIDLTTHAAAADPHTGYQKESEKDAVNGYAGLDAGGLVPDAKIAATIARDSEVTSAVSAHAALTDPHTGYVLESLVDAKGDLIVGSAADTVGRLAPGTDTHVLTLDSAQSLGVKWSAPSGGGATIYQNPSAPGSPVANDLWLDTDEGAETGLSSIIGYAQVTASQLAIGNTEVDLAGLTVTVTVPAGRRIRITGLGIFQQRTNAALNFMFIKEGATLLHEDIQSVGAVDEYWTPNPSVILSPSAGTHTYKLSARSTAGTVELNASVNTPAYLLVEDITGTLWPAGQSIGVGAIASEQWTDYTPTLTQSVTLTKTVTYARYLRVGRMITVQVLMTITSAGTAGNPIIVGLPVAAATPAVATASTIGSFSYQDTGTAVYSGTANFSSAVAISGQAHNQGAFIGQAPSFAAANTDVVSFCATYEAAS